MALRVLLDHGVRQDHIIFVTFLVARSGGISVLHRAFPQVKVVCGAIDENLREAWLDDYEKERTDLPDSEKHKFWVVEPGMGQIGAQRRASAPSRFLLGFAHRGSLLFMKDLHVPPHWYLVA